MSDQPRIPLVDLGAQFEPIRHEIRAAMDDVLDRGDFILGSKVDAFEAAFARYSEVDFAVGLDSGLSAIELGLRAMGVGPGDEVITAANTFIASVLPISAVGATPVLVDSDPDSYGMDPHQLEAAITTRTKVILPVHLYGRPAEMDAVTAVADSHGLRVLEDACQAHGARYRGAKAGSLGHAAAFSFYPSKNLGAYGDAGVMVTDDPELDARVRLLRNYGARERYHHEVRGFNRRLDTLQAAVLLVKLRHLDEWNRARRQRAARYERGLWDTDLVLPRAPGYVEHVFHLYVVRTPHRDGLQRFLSSRGIATGIHYPVPVHLQPAYRSLGYRQGDFPVAERLASEVLSLPMYAELEDASLDRVTDVVREYLSEAAEHIPTEAR